MASYTSARESGGVQGRPASQVNFNGQGGIRRKWWWQAGPVDSCCCCCSLRAGVAVLAMVDFLVNGIWGIFFMQKQLESLTEGTLALVQEAYTDCLNRMGPGPACDDVANSVKQLQDSSALIHHLPPTFFMNCVICMIAGAVGLWAVFGRSALAAKLYMYSWPLKYLLGIANMLFQRSAMEELDVQVPHHYGLVTLLNTVAAAYYLKVCWSYHKVLRTRRDEEATAHTGTDVGVEAGLADTLL